MNTLKSPKFNSGKVEEFYDVGDQIGSYFFIIKKLNLENLICKNKRKFFICESWSQ